MLKNIDPLLTPDLLKLLCEMGHGDELVLADANFTAHSLAAGKPVLPLDAMVARPVAYMQVGGSADGYCSALQREVIGALVQRGDARADQCEATERFAFYDRVRGAFAIVLTGERQSWANFLFKKGLIADELRP